MLLNVESFSDLSKHSSNSIQLNVSVFIQPINLNILRKKMLRVEGTGGITWIGLSHFDRQFWGSQRTDLILTLGTVNK